ncbi:MAG: DUF2807 domain-containing protein [Fimbriimonas sp.]|nr:DUF2807 domain-containing protein [Fimbriimonas sp.]
MGPSHVRKFTWISLTAVAACVAAGCSIVTRGMAIVGNNSFKASGPITKQDRKVGSFAKVEAGSVFEVDITVGSRASLTLEAPKTLIPHLTSSVRNGTLSLGVDVPFSTSGGQKLLAHITVPHLTGVSISGAGRLIVTGNIQEPTFVADASGASHLTFSAKVRTMKIQVDGAAKAWIKDLEANSLELQTSGAAQCTLNGTVKSSTIEADGASGVRAKALTTDQATVSCNGSSNAELSVVSQLKADASGASSIHYFGNPKATNNESGVAHISRG